MMKRLLNKIANKKLPSSDNTQYRKISYSQSGEDLIVKFIFDEIGIKKPSYIDIGAHHPYYLNNTAIFHELGSKGINIEPDPSLFYNFQKYRANDINLNIGVSNSDSELDFFIINVPTLNTFSKEEAEKYSSKGDFKVVDTKKIKVHTLTYILNNYNQDKFPHFLTIDAEGIDEIVLKSIDYINNFPIVICVETISFSQDGTGIKNYKLIEFLQNKGYILYADTNINSIFVRRDKWIRG